MLNIFRRRDLLIRIFVGTILVLVSLAMVITLIPGLIGISTETVSNEVVAQVGDERITSWELQQSVQQLARVNRIPSDMTWLYTSQVLEQMLLEKLTMQQARRLGLDVTEDELRARLKKIPELFPGGVFIGQQQYESIVLERFGMTVPDFEQRFRNSILVEKLRQFITDAVVVTPEELHEAFVRDNEKFVLAYVFLDPGTLKSSISATDAALQAYFEKNRSQYEIPEKRAVQILLLNREGVRQTLSVSDAERRQYYQRNLDSFREPERVAVSHILVRVTDKEPAKLEAARKKAEDLLKRLKGGDDFATLARSNSDDSATAVKGGDLGWIVRGQTVPEFERAAFSLAPGTLSEPVQTEYGIHILKVRQHEQARLKPLEEVRAEIDAALLDEKVSEALSRGAEQLAVEWRRSPDQAESVANRYGAIVLNPPPIARDEAIPGLGEAQALLEDLFVLQENEIGRPVPVGDGYAVPRLLRIAAAHPADFAEVKEKVRNEYLDAEANALALARGQELVKALSVQGKKDLTRVARDMGLVPKTSAPVTRSGSLPDLGSVGALGEALRSLKPGEVTGPISVGGGQAVIQLISRQPPGDDELPAQQDAILSQLLSRKRSFAFSVFQENLRRQMEASGQLKINKSALDRLSAVPANL